MLDATLYAANACGRNEAGGEPGCASPEALGSSLGTAGALRDRLEAVPHRKPRSSDVLGLSAPLIGEVVVDSLK